MSAQCANLGQAAAIIACLQAPAGAAAAAIAGHRAHDLGTGVVALAIALGRQAGLAILAKPGAQR